MEYLYFCSDACREGFLDDIRYNLVHKGLDRFIQADQENGYCPNCKDDTDPNVRLDVSDWPWYGDYAPV